MTGRHRKPTAPARIRVILAGAGGTAGILLVATTLQPPAPPMIALPAGDWATIAPYADPAPAPPAPMLAATVDATVSTAPVVAGPTSPTTPPATPRPTSPTTTAKPPATSKRAAVAAPRATPAEVPVSSTRPDRPPVPPTAPARVSCAPFEGTRGHVAAAGWLLAEKFNVTTVIGVASRSGASDHPSGYALDFMVGRAVGDDLAAYVLAHRDELGVSYVIWEQRYNDGSGWDAMDDRGGPTANHFDHVHVSFSKTPPAGGAPTC